MVKLSINLLLISLGGAIGSCLRYLVGYLFIKNLSSVFPLAILSVNLLGAFLIGVMLALSRDNLVSHSLSLLINIGLLGGLTTFSSFILECFDLLNRHALVEFFLYLFLTLLGGLLACFIGIKLVLGCSLLV